MLLFLLAYLGGLLTILSPCILPVLPFVLARADKPFVFNGLPMLAGMATAFTAIASLAAVGGGWAVAANSGGRIVALVLMGGFALLLLFPHLSDRVMRPLVGWGEKLSNRADKGSGLGASLLLGVATGLLWAPCAGPILGLILTGAALSGASTQTAFLLLAYGLGAATSLAGALLIGGKVFAAMKRSIGAGEWVRRGLGFLILGAVAFIALGLDTRLLTQLSAGQTSSIEQGLTRLVGMDDRELSTKATGRSLPDEGPLPSTDGAVAWLNSAPLSKEELQGKVVLIDFWTYSCINCIRTVPYVEAWHQKYAKDGLVVIGVHTPEFAFERDIKKVEKSLSDLGISYPVAIDNDWTIWRAFSNRFWPAHYLADAKGRIRYHHFGEGKHRETEAAIRALLLEAGAANLADASDEVKAQGQNLAADFKSVKSPETYVGWGRAANNVNEGGIKDRGVTAYTLPTGLTLNQWGYGGNWDVAKSSAAAKAPGAAINFLFEARDLHLVLGSPDGKPRRFQVLLDGKAPGADAGLDIDAKGFGTITDHRLYQLVRNKDGAKRRQFEIRFLDAGAEVYAFTFG